MRIIKSKKVKKMKNNIEIKPNIFWIGANDRKKDTWENYWPLPNGMAYNAYVIKDEKIALVECMDKDFYEDYIENIKSITKGQKVDYLVINHVEPDHSGAIKDLIREYPEIQIVGNKKTYKELTQFYGELNNFYEIKDKDIINLGQKSLTFYMTPMLHWPETMMTYLNEDKILFSCDAFGSYGTNNGGIFDDQMNWDYLDVEVQRYYTNIVGKYCANTQNALKKLKDVEISLICPSHGRIWRSHIDEIIAKYDKWSSYNTDKGVVIAYSSMYGHTEQMADIIAHFLVEYGIKNIRIYDVSKVHPSYIINDLFNFKGAIFGSCSYNNGIFPMMGALLEKIENVEIKNHYFGYFANKSWAGGAAKRLSKFQDKMKWQGVETSCDTFGTPESEDIELCRKIAKEMADKLNSDFPE